MTVKVAECRCERERVVLLNKGSSSFFSNPGEDGVFIGILRRQGLLNALIWEP